MLNLFQLAQGQSAQVVKLEGGAVFAQKLQNLGIREGVTIKKIRAVSAHGPIIIKAGRAEIALGKGMAAKIIVEEQKVL